MKGINRKVIALFLTAVVLLGSLSLNGCRQQSKEAANQVVKDNIIVVTDGAGRQVKIEKKVERIVDTYGIATHMVFVLGAQDKLIGTNKPSLDNAFFNSIKPDFSKLSAPGTPGEVNVEELLALKPDIVLVPGRNKEMISKLENSGLTVFGVVAEDLNQLKNTAENLGKAFGEEEKAAKFIKYYDDTIAMVKDRTRDLKDEQKPVVFLSGPMGFLSTASKDMYQNFLIDLSGGKNAGGQLSGGWASISAEQVLDWNPDLMLLVTYSRDSSPDMPQKIISDAKWKNIKAVKNKQVFFFPSNISPWDYPSPQAVLGIKWLAQKLHPDLFKETDMLKEADSFFKEFYGKTFTEIGGKLE